MKHLLMACLATLMLAGCESMAPATGVGAPVKDIPVVVAPGYSLERAVLGAAARRRWTPSKTSDTTYRLTIDQRENHVAVDVVMDGDKSFSILPVESTITVAKYDQWVNNLQREISMRAQRGQ